MLSRALQLSIFLWNLVLIGLRPVAAFPEANDYTIQRRSYRHAYDHVYRSVQNPTACSDSEMQVIRAGLGEAQQLANAASRALRVRGVETSLAFKTWFGTSNASPQFVTKLINQHYGTAYSHLVPPTIPVTLSFEERTKYVVGNGVPQPGLDSLIYLCPPKSGFMSDLCDAEDVARVITVNVKGRRVGPTMLTLCPTFFNNRGFTNAKMVQSYQRDIYKELYSNGFYLLHELQHMPKATYPDPGAIDVVGPQGGTCYSIRCCALLEHDQKIRNAQNYAFFALDAAAYPDAVKPASS